MKPPADLGIFEYYADIDHFEANPVWYELTGRRRGEGVRELGRHTGSFARQEILSILHSTNETG